MEVVQGKSTDKKIIVAQEIAFAKVLAGNNKTLRDRALKKLRKWLSVRGHSKWTFTEDEFIRIWTGLFYCMWMSDKFLVQEELAENISALIHCFRKNRESALLFMKCFNKRLLMEYEGLDQYRIDKFHMLIRRFLRQCLVYCKRIEWDNVFLKSMVGIITNVIFHKNSALGYIMHFMNIYLEELAKVSKGKLDTQTVLLLIEPFVKLLAKTKDDRLHSASLEFFNYLMRQTDAGIEFEEKFNYWKKLGFPGSGLNAIQKQKVVNGHDDENEVDSMEEGSDDDFDDEDKPLDPRAGSVHVDLPQIPLDIDGLIKLFKKYEHSRETTPKGKKKIRTLIQKFSVLKKNRFPARIKKDPILDEKRKKPRATIKTAKNLIKHTEEMESGPIKSRDFARISEKLEKHKIKAKHDNLAEDNYSESDDDNVEEEVGEDDYDDAESVETEEVDEYEEINEENDVESDEETTLKNFENIENQDSEYTKTKLGLNKTQNGLNKIKPEEKNNVSLNNKVKNRKKKHKKLKNSENQISEKNNANMEDFSQAKKKKKKRRKKKKAQSGEETNGVIQNGSDKNTAESPQKVQNGEVTPTEKQSRINGSVIEELKGDEKVKNSTPVNKKNGVKRKVLTEWLVQELKENDPEYCKIKPPKVIKLDNKPETPLSLTPKTKILAQSTPETFSPVFWSKDKVKALSGQKKKDKNTIFINPMAIGNNEMESPSLRRISFALEKNMAQENDEYLEEVRNSPKVPFDGSKKPIQSALKSGLSPSPINPFYRLPKIKF